MSENLDTAASSEEVAVEKVAIATETAPSGKKLKVKFLLSPTGKFGLGYNVDEVASFPKIQATELIEAGYAELVK
jgi:hypothetical protein